jgi:hypothetical protein
MDAIERMESKMKHREGKKRPIQPIHGRNTQEVIRNSIAKNQAKKAVREKRERLLTTAA